MNINYSKKLSKYISVSTLIALSTATANSEIVYVDVDPDHSIQDLAQTKNQGNDFFDIIIEGDTVMQIGNNNKYWTTATNASSGFWNGVWASGYYYNNGLNASTNNAVIINTTSGSSLPEVINAGESIGLSNNWFSYGALANFSYNSYSGGNGLEGNFLGVTDKYVGARFNVNGEVHYGWMRFDVLDSAKNFTFKDYAYENCPGAPIKAGQTSGGIGVADTVTLSGCNEIIFNGKTYTETGFVYDTLQGASQFGCDSLTPLDITIINSVIINTSDTINSGESIMLGGSLQTESGTYTDTLTASNGCDSIINTNLIVSPLGITSINNLDIKVYPNPSKKDFTLDLSNIKSNNIKYSLIDNLGRVLEVKEIKNHKLLNLNILESGIYFIKIEADDNFKIMKLIKE